MLSALCVNEVSSKGCRTHEQLTVQLTDTHKAAVEVLRGR